MPFSRSPKRPAPTKRAASTASDDFSLDEEMQKRVPPGSSLKYYRIRGAVSYDAELPIKHGDIIGVIPDHDTNPDALMVVRIGKAHFIRPRRQIEWMVKRISFHMVGCVKEAKRTKLYEVVGIVLCLVHFPAAAVRISEHTSPLTADRAAVVAPFVAGKLRRQRSDDDDEH